LDISDSDFGFLNYLDQPLYFKLEHFKGVIDPNMHIVIKQRESLQSLSSDQIGYEPFMRDLLTQFPKLSTLELTECYDRHWVDAGGAVNAIINLPINTTIKSLKLQFKEDQSADAFSRDILLALPELESLDIEELTTETMELIALNLHKLKELKCDIIEDGAWERYEEMKQEGIEEMNSIIQLSVSNEDETL
jgi:hypothetical protein